MGMLDDIVASAIESVAAAVPEIVDTMVVGDEEGTVARTSSTDEGIDPVSVAGAAECVRVAAKVADFPYLTRNRLAFLNGEAHLVTSLRKTGGAAWFVGLSSPLAVKNCILRATRSIGGMTRPVVVNFSGYARTERDDDPFNDNAHSSTRLRVTLVAKVADFYYAPECGNTIEFDGKRFAVISVENQYNHEFVLEMRSC